MSTKALTNAILALHATAHLEPGKELPTRLLICPWGTRDTNKGRIICNHTTLRELPINNARAKRDHVALDFNHNTVEGSSAYKGEPAKVAAHSPFEVVENEGIYLSALDWTPEGTDHGTGGHYPDVSPAIACNDKGEIIFLHSAGLARQGEIDGVTLFSAPSIAELIRTFNADPSNPNPDMNYKALICAILGLADTATDEEITAAAKEFGKGDVKTMSARLKTLEDAVQTFSTSSETAQRTQLVERAGREGKVIPLSAEQIAGLPIETFSALVDGLPVTVPIEKRTGPVKEFSAAITNSTTEDLVREQLGISKEAWDKSAKS